MANYEYAEEYYDDEMSEEPELEEDAYIDEAEEEEPEYTDEDFFEFEYEAEDGKKTAKLNIDDLPKIYREYEEQKKVIEQLSVVQPLVDTIKSSELLKNIFLYKNQGYSDEQIIEGLISYYKSREAQQIHQEAEEYKDDIQLKIEKELAKHVVPLQNEIKNYQYKTLQQETAEHNNTLLQDALTEVGLKPDEITKEDLTELGQMLRDLYPDADLTITKINKRTAKLLANYLAANKVSQEAKTTVRAVSKISKLPRKIAVKSAKARSSRTSSERLGGPLSLEERISLKDELFG